MTEYIKGEPAAERLRDGYADDFLRHDALITQVLPTPVHRRGATKFLTDAKKADAT